MPKQSNIVVTSFQLNAGLILFALFFFTFFHWSQESSDKYYSLLYQKSMIPKPDSVKEFKSYLVPYESTVLEFNSYRNFALGATYSNFFKKHTFGLEVSLPYTGQKYQRYEEFADLFQERLKYTSKNYIQRRYKNFKIAASWKYLLQYSEEPFAYFSYKNAPTPNDSVPVVIGKKQTRYFIRGGLEYHIFPNMVRLQFGNQPDSPFDANDNGFLLMRSRNITLNLGFERQKEHHSSTSIDRVKFWSYHKMRHVYADILFQPVKWLGNIDVVDSITFITNDPSVIATSEPMSKTDKDYIKDNVVKLNQIGLRVGYGYDHLFNSPIGLTFELGVLTGVNQFNAILGTFYSRIRLKMDIRLTEPLRTDGIAW